jgi:uncharacterized RDD family membrane protein YckC
MAKVIVNPTSSSKREISLPRSLLSIGRDPSNDVVLPDAMVSRRHAVIEYRGTQYYLRDCNSSNGSLVNGDRVSERSLRDGDLVAIGTARLLFREDLDPEEAGAKVVQHPSSPRLHCPQCQADYRKGDQFCRQCGAQVAPSLPPKAVCASCGTAVPLPARFCSACGTNLPEDLASTRSRPQPEEEPAEPAQPAEPAEPAAVAAASPSSVESPEEAVPSPVVPKVPLPLDNEPGPPRVVPASRPDDSGGGRGARALAIVDPPAAQPARVPTPEPAPPAVTPSRPASRPRLAGEPHQEKKAREVRASQPATFGPRLLAGLIDAVAVTLAQGLLVSPVVVYWWSYPFPARLAEVPVLPMVLTGLLVPLAALAGVFYHVYFVGTRGATPGKRQCGLSVEGEDGRFPIGPGRAAVRFLGYVLSASLLGIGFLMIFTRGGSLHDRIAGTRVVRRERT